MRPAAIQIERFHTGKRATLGKGGAVVRTLAPHQCGPNPGVDAICGLGLLLILFLAPISFFPGCSGFPLSSKTNICEFQFDQEKEEGSTPTGVLGHQYGGSDVTSCQNALLQQGAKKCDL